MPRGNQGHCFRMSAMGRSRLRVASSGAPAASLECKPALSLESERPLLSPVDVSRREDRRPTRDPIAPPGLWDVAWRQIIDYFAYPQGPRALQAALRRIIQMTLPAPRGSIKPSRSYRAACADGLGLCTPKWHHRPEKCTDAGVGLFAGRRESKELRLAIFQGPRDWARANPASGEVAGAAK